jgi:hypothetical protein
MSTEYDRAARLRARVGLPHEAPPRTVQKSTRVAKGASSEEAVERARAAQAERQREDAEIVKANLAMSQAQREQIEAERDRARAEAEAWRAVAEDNERLTLIVTKDAVEEALEPEVDEEALLKERQHAEFEERITKRTKLGQSVKLQKVFEAGLAREIADAGWYLREYGDPHLTLSHERDADPLSDEVLDAIQKSWEIKPNSNATHIYLIRADAQ